MPEVQKNQNQHQNETRGIWHVSENSSISRHHHQAEICTASILLVHWSMLQLLLLHGAKILCVNALSKQWQISCSVSWTMLQKHTRSLQLECAVKQSCLLLQSWNHRHPPGRSLRRSNANVWGAAGPVIPRKWASLKPQCMKVFLQHSQTCSQKVLPVGSIRRPF